jgi:hypothetical protein
MCPLSGCSDRARFEFVSNSEVDKIFYAIEITTDPSWTTWQYIDGNTQLREGVSTFDIFDFLRPSDWTNGPAYFNLLGLAPQTTYYLRARALNHDLTTTYPGPISTFATASTESQSANP